MAIGGKYIDSDDRRLERMQTQGDGADARQSTNSEPKNTQSRPTPPS